MNAYRWFGFRLALLAAVVGMTCLAADAAQAQQDRYALVAIENNTDLTLNFQYRFDGWEWVNASLEPGGTYHIWAEFTYPGSYQHDLIELRWDEDLRPGQDHFRILEPYVGYAPDVEDEDFELFAQWYEFFYEGPDFVNLYRID